MMINELATRVGSIFDRNNGSLLLLPSCNRLAKTKSSMSYSRIGVVTGANKVPLIHTTNYHS